MRGSAVFATLLTPERREALSSVQGEYGVGNTGRRSRKWAATGGFAGLAQNHGPGPSAMDQLIFTDEAAHRRGTGAFLTINSVAPTIMAYGTDEQRFPCPDRRRDAALLDRLPGRRRHRLANHRTTAVRDGDDYVVNGQKVWTSGTPTTSQLAVRTNPVFWGKKHRGISVLIGADDLR